VDVGAEGRISSEDVLAFMAKRKSMLDGVVVTGGEPTIQKELFGFLAAIKNMGLAVKLDTNGSRPDTLAKLLADGLVDYVAMDVKALPERYPALLGAACQPGDIERSIRIVKESGIDHEFRTTCSPAVFNTETAKGLAQLLFGARMWALQQCRLERILSPDFFRKNATRLYDNAEMAAFAGIGAACVSHCIVR
jgi:pyruvate formate lyase activating enzyme